MLKGIKTNMKIQNIISAMQKRTMFFCVLPFILTLRPLYNRTGYFANVGPHAP
jgi:hypothetical protein